MSALDPNAALGAAPPSASSAAALPLRRDASPAWQTGGLGVPAALALVLLLAIGAAWWIRRRQGGPNASRVPSSNAAAGSDFWRRLLRGRQADGLCLMQSVRLSSRASVHVVRWAGKQWLLGATDDGVSLIAQQGDAAGNAAMNGVASPEQSA